MQIASVDTVHCVHIVISVHSCACIWLWCCRVSIKVDYSIYYVKKLFYSRISMCVFVMDINMKTFNVNVCAIAWHSPHRPNQKKKRKEKNKQNIDSGNSLKNHRTDTVCGTNFQGKNPHIEYIEEYASVHRKKNREKQNTPELFTKRYTCATQFVVCLCMHLCLPPRLMGN